MSMNVDSAVLVKEFVIALSGWKKIYGHWIPLQYFTEKIKHQLGILYEEQLTQGDVFTALEELSVIDRDFVTSADQVQFGKTITRITTNRTRIKTNGRRSRQTFLCFETKTTKQRAKSSTAELQEAYDMFYNRRQTIIGGIREWRQQQQMMETVTAANNNNGLTEEHTRCVTPMSASPVDEDIKELLKAIGINPKYLDKEDLFVADVKSADIRDSLRHYGCNVQLQLNEKTCKMLAENEDNDKLSKRVDSAKYLPFLEQHNCPLRKSSIQRFIHLGLSLAEEGIDIFQLNKHGGSRGSGKRLVRVIPSKTAKHYYNNAKKWLPELFDALLVEVPDEKSSKEWEDLSQYDQVYLLIKALRTFSVAAFEDVCRTMSEATGKMDPTRQSAMMQKAGLRKNQLRAMKPFLMADPNCIDPFNSEHVLKDKVEATKLDVEPVYTSFKEDNWNRHGYHLPFKEALESHFDNCSKESQINPARLNGHGHHVRSGNQHLEAAANGGSSDGSATTPYGADNLHINLSADHGQSKFLINLALIFIRHGQVVHEDQLLIASIDCKKDTRQVLVDSGIINALNEGLLPALESLGTKYGIPIELFGCFDLAALALLLGKEGSAGWHCCLCKWMRGKDCPEAACERWTLNKLEQHHAAMEQKDAAASKPAEKAQPAERCGVVNKPLLTCIKLHNIVTPVLHVVTLFTNTAFKYMHRWIWNRVEGVPLELIEARESKALALFDKERKLEDFNDAKQYLKQMRIELKELKPGRDGRFDDTDHEAEHNLQKEVVKLAEDDVAKAKTDLKDAKEALSEAATHLKALEINPRYGKTTQELWMSIQNILQKDYNVSPSSYHGGDMEGNQCRILMKRAPEIICRVKELLLQHRAAAVVSARACIASAEEIELFCNGFQHIFQHMDLLSHYCYQSYGSLSDQDLTDAKTCVCRLTQAWKNVMPTIPVKVHMWQHLVANLRRFRRLQNHNDSHIERAHQVGVKDNRRFCGLRNFKLKTEAILKSRATMRKQSVQSMLADTEAKRRRNKKQRVDSNQEETAIARTIYFQSILTLPPIIEKFPSLDELAQMSLQHQHQ